MPLFFASNKVRISCIEAHNDVEAQASWPPSGCAPGCLRIIKSIFTITPFTDNGSKEILSILLFIVLGLYTPPHFSVGVLCYTFRCLSVRPSVRPCSPFLIDNLSIYSRNFFKFCIHIVIGDEWYGIVNWQNPSIFDGVTALFRIGKMVSGLLFLYCS